MHRAGIVEGLVALRHRVRPKGRTLRAEWQGWATGLLRALRPAQERRHAIANVLYIAPPAKPKTPPHDSVCEDIATALAVVGVTAGAYLALTHIARQLDTMVKRRVAREPQSVWNDLSLLRQWCEVALRPEVRAIAPMAAAEDRRAGAAAYPTTTGRESHEGGSLHRLSRTG